MLEWLRRYLWKVLCVVVGAAIGGLLGFVWDDIDARVRQWIQGGRLGGLYVLKTWTYEEKPPYAKIESLATVDLKHGGTRVFGTVRSLQKEWKFYGYVRQKFLALAYGGVKVDGLGTGTFSLQQEVEDVFWGYATRVECIGEDALFVRCPCVMYKEGRTDREDIYREFLRRDCEKITLQPAQSCKEKLEWRRSKGA